MAKRTNSVDTTFFSLELLRRIPRSQRITAQELHQQLRGLRANGTKTYAKKLIHCLN